MREFLETGVVSAARMRAVETPPAATARTHFDTELCVAPTSPATSVCVRPSATSATARRRRASSSAFDPWGLITHVIGTYQSSL